MNNGLGNTDALQHAFRELAQLFGTHITESNPLQDRRNTLLTFGARKPRKTAVVIQELRSAQIVVEIRLFGKKADTLSDLGIQKMLAENGCRSGSGKDDPHQEL